MNWRTFSVVTATLLILPLGTYAAQRNHQANNISESTNIMGNLASSRVKHGRKHGRGGGMKKLLQILQKLDLTSEQSQEIEAIKEKSRREKETLRQQLQTNRQELRSLFASNSTSEQLQEEHQQLQALHQQLTNNRFNTMLQVREILTPEQRTQMAELMTQRGERKGRHRQ